MDTAREASDGLLHGPFETQAARHPNRVAVRCGAARLSYGELSARADALALRLRRAGVGPEMLVGLFIDRTPDAVVGLLGILKAGGAYLPLDPANPPQRNGFIIADAEPRIVVAQSSLRPRIAELGLDAARLLWLDEPGADEGAAVETPQPGTDSLAYVIYTSGSTGQPKGTLITHRNADRLFHASQPWFDFNERDVWTVFHSFAFDFSVWELWGALRHGGTAVIVPADVTRSPAALHALLRAEGVTVLCQTPSAFYALIDAEQALPAPELPALRSVIFGGEALEFARLAPWFARHGSHAQLVNMYGITETTVHVTYHPISADSLGGDSCIGVPLPDLQVHLLDEQLAPVAAGEVGEIYVGGPGVARGYLKRPELTAQRFVQHALAETGGRLYRSGDLARRSADGRLVFCGRADEQVKIRGYRIELGEIVSALEHCADVRRAAVLLRDGAAGGGTQELVAYLVSEGGSRVSPGALRAALAATLPAYMLPAAFVTVPAWPLTTNGKLDKAALPAPRREDRVDDSSISSTAGVARTETEGRVAALWSGLLGHAEVGVHDNLFELGAHSLMVARACATLQQRFCVAFTIADVMAAPNVAALAARIDAAEPGNAEPPDPGPQKFIGEGLAPTALAQDPALFFAELVPDTLAYNNQCTIRLRGALRVDLLERTLSEIVRRHEALRTTFVREADGWKQRVHAPWSVTVDQVDDAPGRLRELTQRRFDPARLPLLGWTLVRMGPQDHLLVHVEHHLIHDGWSFGVFVRELMALYGAYHAGQASPLPELPIQFGDYARWQRQRHAQGRFDAGLAYWARQLAGAPPVLELPGDKPRPASQAFRGDEILIEIPAPLARRLRGFARSRQSSLFCVMLAGFAATLARFAAQDELVIGSGFANREHAQVEPLIGMIVNMLPLRLAMGDDPSFEALLGRAHTASLEAMALQEIPFETIVRSLKLSPDPSRNPLCQVAFSFHDSALPPVELPGVRGEIAYPHNGSAKFDMNVIVIPYAEQHAGGDERITIKWDCNTDVFERATLQRLAGAYVRALEAGIDAPAQALSRLLAAGEDDRRQLAQWNATQRAFPGGAGIAALFGQVRARTPDKIALVMGEQTRTYAQLDDEADAIARHLRTLGVARGTLVGLCMERCTGMVAALIGVLKAGGAYLPLDPDYPQARLAMMLDDAKPVLVIAGAAQRAGLAGSDAKPAHRIVCLEEEREAIAAAAGTGGSLPELDGRDLAYVIYTSGSTGQPKGVCIEQRSVARLVINADYVALDADERLLQLAPISFDASTFEIWGSLLNGATLVLYRPGLPALAELGEALREQRISTLWLTAALFNQMVDFELESLRGVRQILAGGEALSPEHVRRLLAVLPEGHRLINGYGPTENTTFTCCHAMTRDSRIEHTVPIGKPIANTQVQVLDARRQVVPIGAPGELCIEGEGLARGYLNRPELTAERFVEIEGRRLYRSGDRVRWRAPGVIEFLGRLDEQIKLRGFRIEPGEIEFALNTHPAVRESAVVLRESARGKQLQAFIVGKAGGAAQAELRQYLAQRLPSYMVPAFIIALDALPLTPIGKVDRAALARHPTTDELVGRTARLPGTRTEIMIAEVWGRTLGRTDLSVDDDFFEIGGHSLAAAAIFAELGTRLGQRLPLPLLFETRTIARLAAAIDQDQVGQASDLLVPIRQQGDKAPIYALLGIGGNYLGSELLAARLGGDRPFYSLNMPGLAGESAPQSRVDDVVNCLRGVILAHAKARSCVLMGTCAGALVVHELAGRLELDGIHVEHLLMLDPPPNGAERAAHLSSFGLWRRLAIPRFVAARVWLALRLLATLDRTKRRAFLRQKMAVAREIFSRRDLLRETRTEVQVIQVREAASTALYSFVPNAYSGRTALLLSGANSPDRVAAAARYWRARCTGMFDVIDIPGKGMTATLRLPHVETVAARIRALLAQE